MELKRKLSRQQVNQKRLVKLVKQREEVLIKKIQKKNQQLKIKTKLLQKEKDIKKTKIVVIKKMSKK